MGQYESSEPALLAELAKLRRRIEQLERAAPLRNATISDGGQLIVKGVDGNTLVLMGRSDVESYKAPDGHKQMVFMVSRENGEPAFAMFDPLPAVDGFHQYWALYDRLGNVVVGDDTTSGQGLARPYLPIPFYDWIDVPSQTTTSGSWTTLQRAAAWPKQHPRIQVGLVAQTGGGTTGEVRLWDATNGVQLGSTITLAAAEYSAHNIGPVTVGGTHMQTIDIDIQARRLTGASTIGARVTTAFGVQS